jgi:PilZ domain
MSNPKPSARGEDWTRLLSDPDLLTHLGELLQTYRDSPPETREAALFEAMRKIKRSAAKTPKSEADPAPRAEAAPLPPVATEPADTPPFEPDIFTPSWGQDRRRYPRMKCFVVVELLVAGSDTPIWGTLANTSLGGCLVETPSALDSGAKIEIGLWVASGQIWVKGLILNGVVARANPSFGIRIKFSEMEPAEREALRQFLKFVESTTKGYSHDHGYLAHLKD